MYILCSAVGSSYRHGIFELLVFYFIQMVNALMIVLQMCSICGRLKLNCSIIVG